MHFHTNEYPRVAHIVAELDDIESDMDLDLPLGASAKMMFDIRRNRPSLRRTVMRSAVSLGLVLYGTACASTGATFRSGVGDAFLEKAPYYAGASRSSVSATIVPVLQLTGALIDSTGKAVRIGAEGIAAQRTRLLVSSVGGQELFGDEEVTKVRIARREDLPGQPLAWEVAMRTLVAELTGQSP
jgi:hypothetical protein